MEGDVTAVWASFADLCRQLGIGTPELAAVETPEALAHTFSVSSADAARIDLVQVHAFVEHWGDEARIEIRTGDLTELIVGPGVTDDAVTAFSRGASGGGPYEAVVSVDKVGLARRIAGDSPRRAVRIFLFADALRRLLARGLAEFEAEAWPDAPAPLVIGVIDTDISLTGAHLTIAGGSSLDDVRAAAASPPVDLDLVTVTECRDRYIGWDFAWVRALTPWHFDLTGTCSDRALHGMLRAQLVKLAVLFTCDRARIRPSSTPPGEILAEYRGREHVAVVPIDERAPLDCADAEAAAVLRAVDWCYQRRGAHGEPDWVSDRLPFVQTRVAQALEPQPIADRLVVFTRAMPYLLEGIEWHWKAFIEGKVSEYLDRVQQVETVVGDTVSAFADRTAALAKGLSDTILAAVAVLIGSSIAAAFDTPFNATLFRIGVLSYATYVVLFPGVVGLLSNISNLRSARTEFDNRIKRFGETLYPDKVSEIVGGRVRNAQAVYYHWLIFVAAVYVVVASAAVLAAVTVPSLIRRESNSRHQALAGRVLVYRAGMAATQVANSNVCGGGSPTRTTAVSTTSVDSSVRARLGFRCDGG